MPTIADARAASCPGSTDDYPASVNDGAWPEPVERVAAVLREAGVEARLEEFRAATKTADEAARAAGCSPGQIVKSIVFVCDARPVVALVPGDRRAAPDKVARAAGSRNARVAAPAEVLETTGFEPGAVAPFPLPRSCLVLGERSLLAHELVWVGAGSPSHLASLTPAELLRLSRASPADLVAD